MDPLGMGSWPYRLTAGHSHDPAKGACAMDAINWLVHGKHGDAPPCVCPLIRGYVICGNDEMPDDIRQRLIAYLPRISGTVSAKHISRRDTTLLDGIIRMVVKALGYYGDQSNAMACKVLRASDSGVMVAVHKAHAAAPYVSLEWPQVAAHLRNGSVGAAAVTAVAAADRAAHRAYLRNPSAGYEPWGDYFSLLERVLAAGPQGEPWSVDYVSAGSERYAAAGGRVTDRVDVTAA